MSEEQQEQQKIKTPIVKKWWFWLIIAIAIIAIIGGVFGGIFNEVPNKNTNDSDKNDDSIKDNSNTRVYDVGENWNYDDLELNVEKIEVSDVADIYYGSGQCNADEKYIVLVVNIKNNGNSSVALKKYGQQIYMTSLIYLNNGVEVTYNRSFLNNSHFIDYYDSIMPLGTLHVYYSYKIPKSVSGKFIFRFSENKKNPSNIVEINFTK